MKAFNLIDSQNQILATLILGKTEAGPEGGKFVVFSDALLFPSSDSPPLASQLVWRFSFKGPALKEEAFQDLTVEKGAQAWAAQLLRAGGEWRIAVDPFGSLRANIASAALKKSGDDAFWIGVERFTYPNNCQAIWDEARALRSAEFESGPIR
jgi:hypothetical protein